MKSFGYLKRWGNAGTEQNRNPQKLDLLFNKKRTRVCRERIRLEKEEKKRKKKTERREKIKRRNTQYKQTQKVQKKTQIEYQ